MIAVHCSTLVWYSVYQFYRYSRRVIRPQLNYHRDTTVVSPNG